MSWARHGLWAAAAVAGGVLLDGALGRACAGDLDLHLGGGWLLMMALGAGVAVGGMVAEAQRRWPRWGLPMVLALWSAVWAPEMLRGVEIPPIWGLGIGMGIVLLGAWRAPSALLMTALGPLGLLAHPPVAPALPSTGADGPSVLLLTVDTVRADRQIWPASVSVDTGFRMYNQGISAAPWTLPAAHAWMRGQSVEAHGGGRGGPQAPTLPTGMPALAERFRGLGYGTSAVVSNPHLVAAQGFDAGFQRFVHAQQSRLSPTLWHVLADRWSRSGLGRAPWFSDIDARVVPAALKELGQPGPVFVWVHLLLPHEYTRDVPHPPADWEGPGAGAQAKRQAYDANVATTRARIGHILAGLPAEAPDGAWVVGLVADHGEHLGEDQRWGHGAVLDDANLHVPLAVRGPGLVPGVEAGQVPAWGVGGTLLAAAGLEVEPGRAQLEVRGSLPLSGVRGAQDRAADRLDGGQYTPRSARIQGSRPTAPPIDAHALEALGYLDPASP